MEAHENPGILGTMSLFGFYCVYLYWGVNWCSCKLTQLLHAASPRQCTSEVWCSCFDGNCTRINYFYEPFTGLSHSEGVYIWVGNWQSQAYHNFPWLVYLHENTTIYQNLVNKDVILIPHRTTITYLECPIFFGSTWSLFRMHSIVRLPLGVMECSRSSTLSFIMTRRNF